MRKLIKVALFGILFFASYHFCHKQTGGFALSKIFLHELPPVDFSGLDFPSSSLKEIVNQPFTYLAGGGECYVFESADHKWVIKFFKNHHFTSMHWADPLPKPKKLSHMLNKRRRLAKKFWQSCLYASTDLKPYTQLAFFQIKEALHEELTLTLYDRLHIAHCVRLNDLPFALQPKMRLFLTVLEQDLDRGDREAAQEKIIKAIDAFARLYSKGYRSWDPEIKRNLGWDGENALFIDIGAFEKVPTPTSQEKLLVELQNATHRLKRFLNKKDPSLIPFYEKALDVASSRIAH